MKSISNEQQLHLKFVDLHLNDIFKKMLFIQEHRTHLNELIVKTKDLKTKLYEECLSKDLAKVFIEKIDHMIVSSTIHSNRNVLCGLFSRLMQNDIQRI